MLKEAIKLTFRASPVLTVFLVGLALATGILPLAMTIVGKMVIDESVSLSTTGVTSGSDFYHSLAFQWLMLELLLAIALVASDRLSDFARHTLALRIELAINRSIIERTLSMPLGQFEDPVYHDQLRRAQSEASFRPLQVLQDSLFAGRNAIAVLSYGALIWQFSPGAVLAILATNLPVCFSDIRFSVVAYGMNQARSPILRQTAYIIGVLVGEEFAKESRLFGYGHHFLLKYLKLAGAFISEDRAVASKRAGWTILLSAIALLAHYFCISLLIQGVVSRALSVGALVMYSAAFFQVQMGLRALLRNINSLVEAKLFLANLFGFLAADKSSHISSSVGAPAKNLVIDRIEFRNVSFVYPNASRETLKNLSFSLQRGRRYAFVGANGSGKSTILKLMLGLYAPLRGEVYWGNESANGPSAADLKKRFGAAFQDFGRYHFSVRENVGLGFPDLMHHDVEIQRALKCADLPFDNFPRGLETQLGRVFDDGVGLSGGQWQKIALARAMINDAADVLIFDEPTAALDPEAEHDFFERNFGANPQKLMIFISHRVSSVKHADEIFVVSDGEIVERGSHPDLIARRGEYVKLFASQLR